MIPALQQGHAFLLALAAIVFASLFLVACNCAPVVGAGGVAETTGEESLAGMAHCDAGSLQFLLGQPLRDNTLELARQAAGAEMVRLLHPGDIMTKEYRFGRLNVLVDEKNRIVQVYCG